MNHRKKILIELFDEDQIQNVLTARELYPSEIVLLYTSAQKDQIHKEALEHLLPVRPRYVHTDRHSFVKTVLSCLTEDALVLLDVHGGNDLLIALSGYLAAQKELPLCYPDLSNGELLVIQQGRILKQPLKYVDTVTIRDLIALYGGRIFDDDTPDLSFEEISWIQTIRRCDAYSHDLWDETCRLFSMKERVREKQTWITRREYDEVRTVVDILRDGGIIRQRERGDQIQVAFASSFVRKLFEIEGEWLEFDTCRILQDRSEFSDVRCRIRVDWNGGSYDQNTDASSELDVLAMHQGRLVCISCKTNGRGYDQDFFYQVYANAHKLGGKDALPVLVHTSGKIQAVIRDKARELGILIVEGKDVYEGKTAVRILEVLHALQRS